MSGKTGLILFICDLLNLIDHKHVLSLSTVKEVHMKVKDTISQWSTSLLLGNMRGIQRLYFATDYCHFRRYTVNCCYCLSLIQPLHSNILGLIKLKSYTSLHYHKTVDMLHTRMCCEVMLSLTRGSRGCTQGSSRVWPQLLHGRGTHL